MDSTSTTAAQSVDLSLVTVARVDEECILGRPDLGLFVAVPEPGAVLVEAIQSGASLTEATRLASEAAGEVVDGSEFLEGLAAAGFLEPSAESAATAERSDASGTRSIRWIEGVRQPVAARFFGRAAWSAYIAAALFALGVCVVAPELRPSFEHSWWLPDPIWSILLLTPVTWALRAVHEAWHWLGGRAVGVPAAFRVSYRGVFLVFETDVSQIVTVPRRQRYATYLAGIAIDAVLMALALSVRLANWEGWLSLPGLLDRFLAAVVLVQFLSIAWQFFAIFMRSDAYAVVATMLRCHDLNRATWLTTKDRLWRLDETEQADLESIDAHDRRVARYFGVAYLVGMFAVAWLLLNYAVPFLIGLVAWVAGSVLHPDLASWAFWSSLAALVVVGGQRLLPLFLALRERRLRRTGQLR
ncbi:hypothetical protein [Luteipulveratus mongoliensis]|uniref:hypothetical protein n=1 Tax=Luteipulveratus mongoliensis TaxID=571913 RepID=UPI000697F6FE|nr:hypothetical protein [Luteipulveratus mongoliensis]